MDSSIHIDALIKRFLVERLKESHWNDMEFMTHWAIFRVLIIEGELQFVHFFFKTGDKKFDVVISRLMIDLKQYLQTYSTMLKNRLILVKLDFDWLKSQTVNNE